MVVVMDDDDSDSIIPEYLRSIPHPQCMASSLGVRKPSKMTVLEKFVNGPLDPIYATCLKYTITPKMHPPPAHA